MGVTRELARFTVGSPASAQPAAAHASAKLRFLDTVAIMVAGSRHPSTLKSLDVVQDMGGRPTCSIVGHAHKTSSPLAGYVNGVSAHALEYDDYTKSVTHVSVCLVPGALALAEQLGASGKAVLEAFVVGFQVESQVGRALRPALLDRGWHPNGILGAFGIVGAAARLMGLDETQTRMAFGLAASQGSGVRKNVGSMGKAFHVGHGVRCGIFAALLAAKDFKVDPDIIEGSDDGVEGHDRFGMADTFNGIGNHRLEMVTQGLGTDWELANNTTIVRMHPGSTAPGASIDCMIDLATGHDLRAEAVEAIEIECTPQCLAIAPYPTASDSHKARFCLAYSMAVSLIDRRAGIAQYTDERVNRADVQSLMQRVRVIVPDDFRKHRGQWGEGGINWGEMRLTVRLKDGQVLKTSRSHARGWSEDPATWDDLMGKYEECAEGIFPADQVRDTAAMIRSLESLGNVRELMDALRPRGQ